MIDRPEWPSVHIIREGVDEDGNRYTEAVSSMVCDFCGDRNPRWDYGCADFQTERDGSWGGWMACGPCAALVEARDREALLARALSLFPHVSDGTAARAKAMQDGFFANMTGGREPYG